jgi:uncharacterized protein
MRALSPTFDSAIVAEIDARLDAVAASEEVAIPWAIESGSRAWGFPSPDSDYDCRFVYVRRREAYLGLFPPRDVIETPLTDILDVNGWDVAKALRLLLNGNAVILEWLNSADVYRGDAWFRDAFLALAGDIADRNRVARHYLHLGRGQLARFSDDGTIRLKKLFYILRPAMALRWLRLHADARFPPMNLQVLMAGADIPSDLADEIEGLIAKKRLTREMGDGAAPDAIRAFWDQEFTAAEAAFARKQQMDPACIAAADAFFRACLERCG